MNQNEIQSRIDFFDQKIKDNYFALASYYEHHFICFGELRPVIWENINCLLLGLHQASICTTNHLLERMLKYALCGFHLKGCYVGDPEFNKKVIEGKQLYDKKLLGETIESAYQNSILTQNEMETLKRLKNEFRNPYSHAEIAKIIRDQPPMKKGLFFDLNKAADAHSTGEPIPYTEIQISSYVMAQEIQRSMAISKSKEYFEQVFKIMIAIDEKYQKL